MAPDGEVRVQVLPKGDPDDTEVLRHFVTAVLAVEPGVTGPAVMLYEAGNTILRAFIEAGVFAVLGIFVLLWITLRRLGDVAVTLVPLLLAAVLTLELSVVLGMPLNFANIIALPLLLGVGVAFKIYYVTAWRRGMTGLVQSTLTRAVMFSALTTATAFGSLSLSSHPGTSSMGQMMMLALFCTMSAAVLFQPALMGPPRKIAAEEGSRRVAVFAEEDEDEFEPVGRGRRTRRRARQAPSGNAKTKRYPDEIPRRAHARSRWQPDRLFLCDRPHDAPRERGDRQSARRLHRDGARLPCDVGLYRLHTAAPVRVGRAAVPVARLPDRRSAALVRVRPVLRLARRLSDVVLLSVCRGCSSGRACRARDRPPFCRTGCCAWDCRSRRWSCC